MTKTPAQLDAEIAAELGPSKPLTTRQAEYIRDQLAPFDGEVTIMDPSSGGGHHIIIEHKESGHRETYGVSKYGITPGEVRYGSKFRGADKFDKKMRAVINKAKKLT